MIPIRPSTLAKSPRISYSRHRPFASPSSAVVSVAGDDHDPRSIAQAVDRRQPIGIFNGVSTVACPFTANKGGILRGEVEVRRHAAIGTLVD